MVMCLYFVWEVAQEYTIKENFMKVFQEANLKGLENKLEQFEIKYKSYAKPTSEEMDIEMKKYETINKLMVKIHDQRRRTRN